MTTRTRRLRLLAGVLAGGLVAAACASSGNDEAADAATTIGPWTTARPATTAEVAPSTQASTTTAEATTTAAALTTVAATTTTEPFVPRMPLTGIPLAFGQAVRDRPAAVVKVDNAPDARPQSGFNLADIVFEEIVNDSLTRFALIFHSQDADPVGPIRSGRLQDVDLFGSYNSPFFVWSGGNDIVEAAINGSDFVALDSGTPDKYLNRSRREPHQVYSNTSEVWGLRQPRQGVPQQQFQYRHDGEAPLGVPSAGVQVVLDSITARWTWDPASGLYRREMNGRPHEDASTGQVTTNNVVVLVMNYVQGVSDSPDAQSIGYNEAWVFTGGNIIHGTWSRPDRLSPFTLTADDGTPIELTPGRTFVELPRPGATTPF